MTPLETLLLAPATPGVSASIACALVATIGLVLLRRRRQALAGFHLSVDTSTMRGRYIVGHVAAVPLALLLIAVTRAIDAQGMTELLLVTAAFAAYLYLGFIIPREPLVAAKQRARRLRQLLPGFISYVRVSMEGYDAPRTVMERYSERPNQRRAVMQEVVREALELTHRRRLMPFQALSVVARDRGCQELQDVADQLAQAERDGTDPLAALAAFERMIENILRDEFLQMLKRRMMYLLVIVGISIVLGILGTILWVMTRGGAIFFGS
jgi:hypothetical protein